MLHTSDDFLNAIEAQPADRIRRLIFADWLDERDNPRGELIRVEEEMRELPVFADRFWELKPRRNELRAIAGEAWCVRMRYAAECEPVFRHGIPDGWRERWRLIREFNERWRGIPMGDVGGRRAEVEEVETRLGRKLPPSVREWVALTHDLQTDSSYTESPQQAQLQDIPGNAALSLWMTLDRYERFGDSHWAVLLSDLRQPDPPVYLFSHELDDDYNRSFVRSGNKPIADSVSTFALNHVVNCVPRTNSFVAEVEQLSDLYHHLKATFPSHVKFGNCEWNEADNLLVKIAPIPGRRSVFYLHVRASYVIRRGQIPEFLWQYAQLGSSRHGIFAKP